MITSTSKFASKFALAAIFLASATAFATKASAAETTDTPTAKVALKHALTFVGFDTTGIKFDLTSDADYAADSAKYKYHLTINSQFNGSVVGFTNDLAAAKNLANAAILLYEVGQVRNVVAGATAANN